MYKMSFPGVRLRWTLFLIGVCITATLIFELHKPGHTAAYREIEIEVLGSEFVFYFRYPGRDRKLYSQDDRYGSGTLYVPAEAKVHLKLTSLDYLYTFEIPALDVYEMAAPDLVFETHLDAVAPRTDDLIGSQMCGYEHAGLLGKMVVQTVQEFDRTMRGLSEQSLTVKQP